MDTPELRIRRIAQSQNERSLDAKRSPPGSQMTCYTVASNVGCGNGSAKGCTYCLVNPAMTPGWPGRFSHYLPWSRTAAPLGCTHCESDRMDPRSPSPTGSRTGS